uniref:Immunoglobulin subtype domain-containing protein n=1 Tax=Propithecus coquereli TaxID=379532 RepID=A0A2K6ELL7_PROCO
SLSVQRGPMVRSGENVTLSCSSEIPFDVYHLCREGEACGHRLPTVRSHHGALGADFPVGPATCGGTYRCYGSVRDSLYEWSAPSDPLFLCVTGKEIPYLSHVLCLRPSPKTVSGEHLGHFCVSRQDSNGQDPEEVTYAQLDHQIFTQKKITPTSQRPKEPSVDTTVYVELGCLLSHESMHRKTLRSSMEATALSQTQLDSAKVTTARI